MSLICRYKLKVHFLQGEMLNTREIKSYEISVSKPTPWYSDQLEMLKNAPFHSPDLLEHHPLHLTLSARGFIMHITSSGRLTEWIYGVSVSSSLNGWEDLLTISTACKQFTNINCGHSAFRIHRSFPAFEELR
jgi:hypothetical protein